MSTPPDATTVVAGNGPSLAKITPGTVLATDRIVRTNNFFFEPCYHLGDRVDLAVIGGDPRVAPFALRSLAQARRHYRISAWTSHDPRVSDSRPRALRALYVEPPSLAANKATVLAQLSQKYSAAPTTGVMSLLMAYAQGARQIILAGMDLYASDQRYTYTPGRHQRDLLGDDLSTRGYDLRLHHPDLDLRLIAWVARQPSVTLRYAGANAVLSRMLDAAPVRQGRQIEATSKDAPVDWPSMSGARPIALLKLARRLRKWQRRQNGGVYQ